VLGRQRVQHDELAVDRVSDARQGVVIALALHELALRSFRKGTTESVPRDRKAPVRRGDPSACGDCPGALGSAWLFRRLSPVLTEQFDGLIEGEGRKLAAVAAPSHAADVRELFIDHATPAQLSAITKLATRVSDYLADQ